MEPNFDALAGRTAGIQDHMARQVGHDGHNCLLDTGAYLEVVHLLADWQSYTELLRVLLEGSQVSGNAVLGLL